MELGYVVAAAKRFWWVVIIGVMVGTGLGYVASLSGTTSYQASAVLIVEAPATGPLSARVSNRYVENEALAVMSQANAQRVADRLGQTPDEVERKVRAEARTQTDAIDVIATRSVASVAIELSNAFAEEYIAGRNDLNNELIDEELAVIEATSEEILVQIAAVDVELTEFPPELSPTEQVLFNQKIQELTALNAQLTAEAASARDLETARGAVRDRVVEPAVATVEISGSSPIFLPAGAIAGGVLGVIAAIFLGAVSGSVVDVLQTQQVLGARVLGAVPARRSLRSVTAVMDECRRNPIPLVEEICVRVETAIVPGDVRKVAVTGTQVGAGATTLAAAIAVQCANRGHRTVLADGDTSNPQLSTVLRPEGGTGLAELIRSPSQVVPERDLMPLGPNLDAVGLGSGDLRSSIQPSDGLVFEHLSDFGYEIIVIDCGALLRSASSVALAREADVVVAVSPLRREKVGNLTSIRGVLESVKGLVLGVANSPRRRWWLLGRPSRGSVERIASPAKGTAEGVLHGSFDDTVTDAIVEDDEARAASGADVVVPQRDVSRWSRRQ